MTETTPPLPCDRCGEIAPLQGTPRPGELLCRPCARPVRLVRRPRAPRRRVVAA